MIDRFTHAIIRFACPLMLLAGCVAPAVESAGSDAPPNVSSAGMVSAADPRAAAAGAEILRQGGSAADAAIATMLALTVVEPQSSGIGGGGFLVYHDAEDGLASYDGRETAPAAATPLYFLDADGKPLPRGQTVPGGKSVGVPGNLRLAALAHREHGTLPWAALFQPAIRLARDGFAITPRMHSMLSGRADHAGMTPWAKTQFFTPAGKAKPAGTMVRNPELAALLTEVATRGADHFYVGPPAQRLVQAVRGAARNPSTMIVGDLASYEAKERQPLCGAYRGHRICGMGPPSSGGTTVFAILKQLERFDLAALGPNNPEAWHLIAESMRLAYADRAAYVGDPDFVAVPTAGLMDPAYLADRSTLISPDRAMERVAPGQPPGSRLRRIMTDGEVPSTSHFSVADRAGNVASLTSTIEGVWGSGLTVDGYFLNNELTDFDFQPTMGGEQSPNRVEGGKRPRSSMSPTIVYGPDGRVKAAVGAAGGVTIIAQVAKAIVGMIDWGMTSQQAIALPQVIGMGERVTVERGTSVEAMIPALRAKGHDVVAVSPGYKANAVEWMGAGWRGGADPRSEGRAVSE